MSNYIVGDIQGCFQELKLLLKQVNFNPTQDHLYLAGDLVARGDDSLAVLRFIKSLGDSAHTVLGNHDLHLLAVAQGFCKINPKDKTQPILQADDKDELLTWLRHQPLLIHQPIANSTSTGFVLTHAGISPAWDLNIAKGCAKEVEDLLQSENYLWLLKNMYSDQPNFWSEDLTGIDRYCYIINSLTRMRFCEINGALDLKSKDSPSQTNHLTPWFKVANRIKLSETIIFGHWAALNGHIDDNIIGLDTGCVWGGFLTMMRWEDGQLFTQPTISPSIKN